MSPFYNHITPKGVWVPCGYSSCYNHVTPKGVLVIPKSVGADALIILR